MDFCQVVSTFCFPLFYLGRPPPVQEVHGFLNTVINLVFSLHTSLSPFFNLSCCFPEHQINNVIPLLRSKKPTATSNNQPSKSKQNSATNYDHPWCLGNFLFTTGKCLNSLAYSLRILKSHTQSTLLNLPPTAFAITLLFSQNCLCTSSQPLIPAFVFAAYITVTTHQISILVSWPN